MKRGKRGKTRARSPNPFGFVSHQNWQITHSAKSRSTTNGSRNDTNPPPLTESRISAVSGRCSLENDGNEGMNGGFVRENNGGNDDFSRRTSLSTTYFHCVAAVLLLLQRKENHRNGILILGLLRNFCLWGAFRTEKRQISKQFLIYYRILVGDFTPGTSHFRRGTPWRNLENH